jgi:hypothetical protein
MLRTVALAALFITVACGGSGADAGSAGMPGVAGASGSAGAAAGGSAGSVASASGAGGLGGAGAGLSGSAGADQGGTAGSASVAGSAGSGGNAGSAGTAGGGAGGSGGMPNGSFPNVLMVGLSTGKPTPGDTLMINRLMGRGFKVTLVADTVVTAASADGKDWILISSSEESANLGTKLRDLPLPILCMEDGSFADMKMASARGHAMATTALNFIGTTPLTGGLSGSVTIAMAPPDPAEMGWGTVGAKAIVAATIVAAPEQAALFGYEKGDDMIDLAAPARRVGFAAREDVASHFTEQGLKVFDTAVDWVLGHK